jgi:hypothetical protein
MSVFQALGLVPLGNPSSQAVCKGSVTSQKIFKIGWLGNQYWSSVYVLTN